MKRRRRRKGRKRRYVRLLLAVWAEAGQEVIVDDGKGNGNGAVERLDGGFEVWCEVVWMDAPTRGEKEGESDGGRDVVKWRDLEVASRTRWERDTRVLEQGGEGSA
jgi:hypothetical protein